MIIVYDVILLNQLLTNLKWVELNWSLFTSTFFTEVSINNGKVNNAPVTMTRNKLFITDLQGFVVSVEFRYSMGCLMARNLCLAINVVKKVDEYRIRRLRG